MPTKATVQEVDEETWCSECDEDVGPGALFCSRCGIEFEDDADDDSDEESDGESEDDSEDE